MSTLMMSTTAGNLNVILFIITFTFPDQNIIFLSFFAHDHLLNLTLFAKHMPYMKTLFMYFSSPHTPSSCCLVPNSLGHYFHFSYFTFAQILLYIILCVVEQLFLYKNQK